MLLDESPILIKFRPGVFEFLLKMREIALVNVSTTGVQRYAELIVSIFDPKLTFFKTIIGRELQKMSVEV